MKIPGNNNKSRKNHGEKVSQKGLDGSTLHLSECPFAILGISKNEASKRVVIKAWRQKMKLFHSDKTGSGDDTSGKILNDAKERALKVVTDKSTSLGDSAQQEFGELYGKPVDEERMDLLWKILTGQTRLPDASNQEPSESNTRWMNKDNFKQDVYGLLNQGHVLRNQGLY